MRSKAIALIGIVSILLSAHIATAQQTEPIHFRTPFAFVVGDTLMPAGEYTMSVVSPTGTLLFRGGHNHSAMVASISIEGLDTADRFKLVFHRYGTHYFLSEIWTPGYKTGRAMVPHAAEMEIAKNGEPQHVALYADASRH